MDYKPQPSFKGNSYDYKKKRCIWFNSAFTDDFTLADGKIIDMTFNVPAFQIYNPNNLKVISYIRDDANVKPIILKMKEPYLTNRSVINTDKEGFPLIYCNHTGVEGMTSISPKYSLNPQQIPRFIFKADESFINRNGLTPNETLIQSTTTMTITKNSKYSINYQSPIKIANGSYTATFSGGNINFNGIIDKSYPLIKDSSGININPIAWYTFDDNATNMLLDSSGNNYNLWNSNVVSYNSTNFNRGNGSASFTSADSTYLISANNNGVNIADKSFTVTFWMHPTSIPGWTVVYSRLLNVSETPNADELFAIGMNNANNIAIVFYSANDFGNSIPFSLLNVWSFVSVIVNKTNLTITLNVNSINGTYTNSKTITRVIQPTANNNYTFGRSWTNTYANGYTGLIDDFRIYDTVLTSTQVSELYNGRLSIYNPPSFELGVELEDTNLTKDNIASIYR